MADEEPGDRSSGREQLPNVRELLERMDEVDQALEILRERTNTLTRLVGLLGQRLDRLESQA